MKIFILLIINFLFIANLLGEDIIVIGNKNIPPMDKKSISKIYTGKLIMIDSVNVVPVNRAEEKIREEFLAKCLHMSDEKYLAYWTVRQYIGKGVAPNKLRSAKEILKFIKRTKGGIGYLTKEEFTQNAEDASAFLILSE